MSKRSANLLLVLILQILLMGGASGSSLESIAIKPDGGAYHVPVQIDSFGTTVYTDMLLDTGSGYVSLSSRTFSRLSEHGAFELNRSVTGVMADGKARKVPIYLLKVLRLSENCELYDIEVAVFSDGDRDILGMNALRQIQPFTMQLEPPVLKANCS